MITFFINDNIGTFYHASRATRYTFFTSSSNNKIMKEFNWYHAMSGLGSCEAGHYEGAFAGDYNPALVVVFSAGFSGSRACQARARSRASPSRVKKKPGRYSSQRSPLTVR